jgi:dolichol-phosphate mannosyltransferase
VTGAAALQIDCDMQDPPELIPQFLQLWEQGFDVVVGIRRARSEGRLLQFMRRTFYWLVRRISDEHLAEGAGDFRLVDRSVIERLRWVNDTHPYTRGLISALAARQTGIVYDRDQRRFGTSKFPIRHLFPLAVDGIVNHSLAPLRLATYIGLAVSLLAAFAVVYCISSYLLHGENWPRGYASLATLLMISIGINATLVGIMGEYIGRIYDAVRRKPLSIIEQTLNLPIVRRNLLGADHDNARVGDSEQGVRDCGNHVWERGRG